MNLVETYPEIEMFFKKNQFSDGDLDLLIQELTSKYNSIELTKVRGVFELKLLEFTLKTQESQNIDKKISKNQTNNIYGDKELIKTIKARRLEKKKKAVSEYKKQFNIKEYPKDTVDLTNNLIIDSHNNEAQLKCDNIERMHLVSDIALKLDWSVNRIQNLIEQRTGIKNAITITYSQYKLCIDIFKARKEALKRQRKKDAINNSKGISYKHTTSSKKSSGVWDRIAKFGPGKIIYIRSR